MENLSKNNKNDSNWIFRPNPNSNARMRLFCFPFGGGGASFYRTWKDDLPPDVELCAVKIPGREDRFREKPFTELLPLVETIYEAIESMLDIPYAFFGHSMGAWIAFELAQLLRERGKNGLLHLFVSGRIAPHLPNPDPPIHNLPEPEFIEVLRRYNGTPDIVLREPELMEIFLPILRADFTVLGTYEYKEKHPLDCPISAFGGSNDAKARYDGLDAWQKHTCKKFEIKMYPGGHFYLKEAQPQLLTEINRDLRNDLYSGNN